MVLDRLLWFKRIKNFNQNTGWNRRRGQIKSSGYTYSLEWINRVVYIFFQSTKVHPFISSASLQNDYGKKSWSTSNFLAFHT